MTVLMTRGVAGQSSGAEMHITWHAQTYAPPTYTGKLLPTAGARVTASVFAIQNGKLLDLTGKTIYWYVDDEFIEGSGNKQTVEFRVPKDKNGTVAELMVRLPDTAGGLVNSLDIPIVAPQVAIDAPFPRGVVAGPSFRVRARAYFFNTPSPAFLAYSWSVNGKESPAEDPENLAVSIEPDSTPGLPIRLSLNVKNPISFLEFAGQTRTLVYGQ
jgi:hypothetical protein